MKTTIHLFFIALLCLAVQAKAQTVSFTYDNDGNMNQRKVLTVGPVGVKASPKDTASVSEVIGLQKVILYPNPTKGQFQVAVTLLDGKQKNYYNLYALSGVKLIGKTISSALTDIDISNYPVGTYLLDIFLGDKVSRWKVIKQ
ncbi:MAG: T9SS type A sorting domain-containing protein [Paludibacter sp.]